MREHLLVEGADGVDGVRVVGKDDESKAV